MIETIYQLTVPVEGKSEKVIEKVLHDEHIHYNHMLLNMGEVLPEHFSNANVYMTVIRGFLTIQLDAQEPHVYAQGSLLVIPVDTKMNVMNKHEALLELVVMKAPAPKK